MQRSGTEARRRWLSDYLEMGLVATIMALFARTWVIQAFVVPSVSMSPTLLPGDHVLVNRFVKVGPETLGLRPVERASVLVVRDPTDPNRLLVKRCIGLPGDDLRITDKLVRIDGSPLEEPYATFVDSSVYPTSRFLDPPLRHRDNLGPIRIGPGKLFCVGDNRDDSLDSRVWGPVSGSDVVGQAVLVYWSTGATNPTTVSRESLVEGTGPSPVDQAAEDDPAEDTSARDNSAESADEVVTTADASANPRGQNESHEDIEISEAGGTEIRGSGGVLDFITRARPERLFRWIR